MKISTDRILTTHVGSLPRPDDLFALMADRMDFSISIFPFGRAALEKPQWASAATLFK